MFHTGTWVVWLIGAAVPAFTLRNPLYSVLILIAAWLIYAALGRSSLIGSTWGSFVKIGVFLLALTIPINAISVHVGRIVLARLPENWPIIGGAITLEAIIAGAANGLSLLTILIVFAAFNAVADHYQLLRATPAFLFQAGVVTSIAVTFVPQMVLSAKEIREAQRIRGHRFRGIRDLLPLILPLLADSLERAIQLAETMEARGFGSTVEPVSQRLVLWTQSGILISLVALLTGLIVTTYVPEWSPWGWILVGLAGMALLAIFALQGRRVRRTRYHRWEWRARDTLVVCACTITVAAVILGRAVAPETLAYTPYPPASLLPPFNPYVGAALLLLALPALLSPQNTHRPKETTEQAS
jgi:energy-coupling factor transport system permease protein